MEEASTVFSPELTDVAFRIIGVAKHDSVCRTSLLAGCLNITVSQYTVLFFRFQLTILQTLYAERTFFHYPAATHYYIRVQHHPGEVIVHHQYHIIQLMVFHQRYLVVREAVCARIVGPVKASYLEWTVIGAIPGTNATVISHHI